MRRMEQAMQARDRTLEALLAKVDLPLPEKLLAEEVEWRQQSFDQQLQQAGVSKEQYLEMEGRSTEDFDSEITGSAREAVKAQFVLDAIAEKEEVPVTEAELGEQIVRRAARVGLAPDDYAKRLVDSGGVATLLGETRRAKALAHVLEEATVTDSSGRPVDLNALNEEMTSPAADTADETASDSAEAADTAGDG
jgi:trigger factor